LESGKFINENFANQYRNSITVGSEGAII